MRVVGDVVSALLSLPRFATLAPGSSSSLAGIPCKHGHALADGVDNPLSQIWRSPSQMGASSLSPQESTHLENGPWVPDGRTRRSFNMPSSLIISPAVVVASRFSCSTWWFGLR